MDIETYQKQNALTRDERMAWWRDGKFGLFVHYGIYSCYGRGEWIKLREGISDEEYSETLAKRLNYISGSAEKWVKCAKTAGAKYMVLTTQHHDGFALWNSKVNPYNSVNLGPRVDIIKEFVDACRKHGIKIGFYFSLVNWQHPDAFVCVNDLDARERFLAYVTGEVRELMTNYGKIDILWYDVPSPLKTAEEWRSFERNQMVRTLQPHIIINERSLISEDFANPEDHLNYKGSGDWEACMRFSTTAFGGVDHQKAEPFKLGPHDIIKLFSACQFGGGNLIFNISPNADGSIDSYEEETLATVGKWIEKHSEAVYGKSERGGCGANGISTAARKGNKVYLWNWIWGGGSMRINGYKNPPKSVRLISTGEEIAFRYEGGVIHLDGLPNECPEDILNFPVFELDFGDEAPIYRLVPANMEKFMNV